MSTRRDIDEAMLRRIADVLDAVADAATVAELERAMLADPALRRVYADYAMIHARLAIMTSRQGDPARAEHRAAVAQPATTTAPWRRIGPIAWAIAAGMLLVASVAVVLLGLMFADGPAESDATPQPVVAVMTDSRDVHWASDPIEPGGDVRRTARIAIEGGTVAMQFHNGVAATVSGPADFLVNDPMRCRLDAGRLHVRIGDNAHGFRVDCPGGLSLIDLGTEFAVDLDPAGGRRVFVFDGAVLVKLDGRPDQRVEAGQAVSIDRGGVATPQPATIADRARYIGLPDGLRHWWTFDDGTARDAIGGADGELLGGARVEAGRLVLDGIDDWMRTPPLKHDLAARTLVVWVHPANVRQEASGVMSVESPREGPDVFDGLAFAEFNAGAWENASELSQRSEQYRPLGPIESPMTDEPVMIALVYEADGRITLYRNSIRHGSVRRADLVAYPADDARVVIGKRHSEADDRQPPAVDGRDPYFAGDIYGAMIFDRALDAAQIASLGELIHETSGAR